MKKLFAEYYALPEDRINEIWANSLIVFDTNVLLNLYRYNDDARKEFIKVIEFYKERLWIPYQVGLEFHRCREDILRKNAAAYQELGEEISKGLLKVIDTLNSQRDYARHPYINMKDIRSKVERCTTSIAKSLKKQEENHPDNFEQDEILDAITQLFDGRVGHDFSEEELATIYQEGEHRFANKVPPGYCDEKNKKDKPKRHLYGDLIVWKQTISHSAEQKKDIIFITDDHKTDWWDKVEGKYTPRKELIKEFAESTGQCVLIYDSSRFLEYAKNNKVKVSQKTINEVEKVKSIDSWWLSDEYNRLFQTALTPQSTLREYMDAYKQYSVLMTEDQKELLKPFSVLANVKYNYFDELRKSIEDMGGYGAVLKRLQETQDYIRSYRTRRTLPSQQIDDVVLNDNE